MGREVGTVTFMAVPAETPPELPSVVELRLTGVVPEPPLEVMLLSAQALTARAKTRQRARMREAGFLNFFMWAFLLLNKIFDRLAARSQKKRPSLKDGDGHDGPGAAEVVPGVGVNVVEQRSAFVCTGVEVDAEFRSLYLAADGYGPGSVD